MSTDYLKTLRENVPNFLESIYGKIICDFGCGFGNEAITMAKVGAKVIVGYDPHVRSLNQAICNAVGIKNVKFTDNLPDSLFDIVISQNAMEHFPDPVETIRIMKGLLKENGYLIITFGPPWFAPYGSHMNYFIPIPWANLIFPEWLIMKWRSLYRSDGARRYEEVEMGLNKMTVKKFERIIKDSGLEITFLKKNCSWGLNFFVNIPIIRELFINHITVVLRKGE